VAAIRRVLQCVAFRGLVFKVASTIAASFSGLMLFLRPGRGASANIPSMPSYVAFRIRIIFSAAEGVSNNELAGRLSTTRMTVLEATPAFTGSGARIGFNRTGWRSSKPAKIPSSSIK
jgi:hypothetical protein